MMCDRRDLGFAAFLACAAILGTSAAARAQDAQSEAGEPRAQTSPAAAAPGAAPSSDEPGAAAPSRSSAAPKPRPLSAAGSPPSKSAAAGPAKGAAAKGAAAKGAVVKGGADRVDLSTATVTGDREQPKVMYVVPWKRSDIGDLSGKPMNSLLNEVLAPVDREEFKREVVYYQAVKEDASQNSASTPAAKQVEK